MSSAAQEVAAMYTTAKKTVELGESYVKSAVALLEQANSNAPRINIAHVRLHEVKLGLLDQLETLQFLQTNLEKTDNEIRARVIENDKRFSVVNENFKTRFANLKSIKLELNIQYPKSLTLFDFIEEESVILVLQRAKSYLNELKDASQHFQHLLDSISKQTEVIKDKVNSYHIEAVYKGDDHIAVITKLTKLLRTVPLPIVTHYDRLSYALHQLLQQKNRNEPMEVAEDSIKAYITNHEAVEKIIFEMYSDIKKCADRNEKIVKEVNYYRDLYHNAINIFSELDEFSKGLYTIVRDFHSLEDVFTERTFEIDDSLDECHRLVAWYECYEEAYHEMLIEKNRRNEVLTEYHNKIKKFQEELTTMWESENSAREDFNSKFGMYLPEQLGAALNHDFPRAQVMIEKTEQRQSLVFLEQSSLIVPRDV